MRTGKGGCSRTPTYRREKTPSSQGSVKLSVERYECASEWEERGRSKGENVLKGKMFLKGEQRQSEGKGKEIIQGMLIGLNPLLKQKGGGTSI